MISEPSRPSKVPEDDRRARAGRSFGAVGIVLHCETCVWGPSVDASVQLEADDTAVGPNAWVETPAPIISPLS